MTPRKFISSFAPLLLTFFLTLSSVSEVIAQVAVSVGVGEIYDDNIYLENDGGLPPIEELQNTFTPQQLEDVQKKPNNRDPDSSFITNPYIALSGAIPLSSYYSTSAEGRASAYIFSEESDNNRINFDTTLKFTANETLIPQPYSLSVASYLRSVSDSVSAGEGSAARQVQLHEANLTTGLNQPGLFHKTEGSLYYSFSRIDYLGALGSSESDVTVEENGSDYFANGLVGTLTRNINDQLDIALTESVNVLTFTNAESNSSIEKTEDELDRIDWTSTVGPTYRVNDRLETKGNIGFSVLNYTEDPTPKTATILDDDGNASTVLVETESSSTSLVFGASATYTPTDATAIDAGISQSRSTDVDGEDVLSRTIHLDVSHLLTDRLSTQLSGRFSQYDEGGEISDPNDLYEISLSLKYALAEALSLSLGYNYAVQEGNDDVAAAVFSANEYEVNRVFVTVDMGLVGG